MDFTEDRRDLRGLRDQQLRLRRSL